MNLTVKYGLVMKDKNHNSGYIYALKSLMLILFFLPFLLFAQDAAFSGSWRTTLGKMDVAVNGSTAEASYLGSGSGGSIEGKISQRGRLLVGNWTIPRRYGRLLLRLSKGGDTFCGEWHDDNLNIGGKWIGVRLNPTFTTEPLSTGDFLGTWDSNYGNMNFTVKTDELFATFRGVNNRGTLSGSIDKRTNQFIGKWQDDKSEGKIILKLFESSDGFMADWWYENGIYGGVWYGVRPAKLEGCITGDCENGWGSYVWSDGRRYDGDWQNKEYHGIGTVFSPQGRSKNRGLWTNGIYQGECLSGNCKNRNSKLKFLNNTVYQGDFSNSLPNAQGALKFPNGDLYEGEFKDGFPYGNGTYTWAASQDKYVGNFTRGKIHGQGSYYYNSGEVYNGGFRRGLPHGQGNMTWPNGDGYEGNWRNGTLSASGKYTFSEGDVYEGRFRNGMKNGNGTYTAATGTVITGKWKEDELDTYEVARKDSAQTPGSPPLIQKIQPVPAAETKIYPDLISVFIAYKFEQLRQIPVEAGEEDGEINFIYYLVHGPAELEDADARLFLEQRAKIKLSNGFLFEKAQDASTRVKQLLSRYRLGDIKPRINVLLEGNYQFEIRSD